MLSGEKDSFWTMLEENMRYVLIRFYSSLPDYMCVNRTSTFLGHVPWLAVILARLPAVVAPLKALLTHCETLVRLRIARGSLKHDLFHYLVSLSSPPRASFGM